MAGARSSAEQEAAASVRGGEGRQAAGGLWKKVAAAVRKGDRVVKMGER